MVYYYFIIITYMFKVSIQKGGKMNNTIVIYYIRMAGSTLIQSNKKRASRCRVVTVMDVLNLNSMIIVYEKRI